LGRPTDLLSYGAPPPAHPPPSEYGRSDRLIPPPPHPMTPDEANAVIVHAGVYGDLLDDDILVDPAIGPNRAA
jgi:hypothetical protein